jgi:hypothetical protein
VLRNPAGLNDTFRALISTVSLSDTAPTKSPAAVAREIMARVDGVSVKGNNALKAWDDFACGTA